MHKFKLPIVLCLLAAAVTLIYANSLSADFVYDDYAFIYNNHEIRTLTPLSKFLLSAETFSEPVTNHIFRPLASFSFALNYAANGLNPAAYRIVNVFFHVLNAFLVFLVLRKIGFADPPSLAGALVFAVHPIHTEAVAWISGRGNVLFLFFFLLAYLLYAAVDEVSKRSSRLLLLAAAVAAYVFSLLAKEMALPLPALLFGHDLYVRRARDIKNRMKLYVPFILVAAAYVVLRAHVLGTVEQVEFHGGSAYVTFLAMLRAVVIYLKLLFVPVNMSLSRHFEPLHSLLDPRVLSGLCIFVLLIAAVFALYRRHSMMSFAIFWFAVTMAPVSNVIPVNAIVADRFLYGPSIAFCIVAAAGARAIENWAGPRKSLAESGLMMVLCLLMLLTVGRNNDWKHPILLWKKTAQSSPTSYVAFNNLAVEYMKAGRISDAVEALEKSLALREDLPETHLNLARCYGRLGRIEEAGVHYSIALKLLGGDAAIRAEMQSLSPQKDRFFPAERLSPR
jgi:hypothetical protein